MTKIKRCEKEWGPPKSPHICDLAKGHAGPCRCTCDATTHDTLMSPMEGPTLPAGDHF